MHCIFSKASLTMIMGILVIVVIDKNITVEADHHHHSLPPPFSPPLPIPPTFIDMHNLGLQTFSLQKVLFVHGKSR